MTEKTATPAPPHPVTERRWFILTTIGLVLYTAVLFYDLTGFPLYFFCDEAIHVLEANSLLHTGQDLRGNTFPLYVAGFGEYQWSASIYAQIPFLWIFGATELAARVRTAVFSLGGVLAVILFFRDRGAFCAAALAPIVLLITPFWFIHARTGFEVILAATFFLALLFFYSRAFSEQKQLSFAALAALSAALCFYSYSPARGWIALFVLISGSVNIRNHWRRKRETAVYLSLLLLLMTPYIIYHFTHPEEAMRRLASFGVTSPADLLGTANLERAKAGFLVVMNPRFWFLTDGAMAGDFNERHVVPGYGEIPMFLLPFFVLGTVRALFSVGSLHSRVVLIAALCGWFPAVYVGVNPLRAMAVGLGYLLLALYGLDLLVQKIARQRYQFQASSIAAACLSIYAAVLWYDVHGEAKRRYRDYAFYGVQMGAPETFTWLRDAGSLYDRIILSNALFNQNEVFIPFYLGSSWEVRQRIEIVELAHACLERKLSQRGTLSVIPEWWIREKRDPGCVDHLKIVHTITAPTGAPLFYMVTPEEFQPLV